MACYKTLKKSADWATGSQQCRELGATLVDIVNNREQYFLDIMLFHNYADHWIGANYGDVNNTQQFMWQATNNVFKYQNWMTLEPAEHMTSKGHCVYISKNLFSKGTFLSSFKWAAANCTERKGVICESRAVQCQRLEQVSNAEADSNSLAVGSVINFSCVTGHEFPDASTVKNITCQMNGSVPGWSTTVPSCSPVKCPNDTMVDNAVPNTDVRKYGTVVTYRCVDGFKYPDGDFSKEVTCLANKTWSDDLPACERVRCSPLSSNEFSTSVGNGTLFEDTHCYTCDTGYMFPGYSVVKCLMCAADAKWNDTLSPCQPLECPDFGFENIETDSNDFTFTSIVSVRCGRGYKFPDNSTSHIVECTSEALWNESIPECEPIQCVPFPPGVLTVSNETGTGFGTTVLVNCPEGQEFLDGNTSMLVRCESLGYWSPSLLSCAPKLNIKAMKLLPPEEAPEAVVVATPAIVLLILFVCTIIILDLTTIQRDFARLKKNLKYVVKREQEAKRLRERRERFKKIYGFYHPYI